MTAAGSDNNAVTWDNVAISRLGTAADSDTSSVKVYLDDGDDAFDAGDTLVSSGTDNFTGGTGSVTVALTPAQTVTNVSPKKYFIVLGIAPGANTSNTIGVRVASSASFSVRAPDQASLSNPPADSGVVGIQVSAGTLNVVAGSANPAALTGLGRASA